MNRKSMFLIVDDEPFILEYVRQVLTRAGHDVLLAEDGERAWTIFERHRSEIELILTDIVMPGSMDGLDLANRIKNVAPQIPILFITGALPSDDERFSDLQNGGLVLRKPFFPNQLTEFLNGHLAALRLAV